MTSPLSSVFVRSARVASRIARVLAVAIALAVLFERATGAVPRQGYTPPSPPRAQFRDAAKEAGIDFLHVNGASEQKFFPEIMGSGGLFLDFDNDGWLDIFLVDGGSFDDLKVAARARHRLYRNRGNGTFEDVTKASRILQHAYGMGACAGDVDHDGLIDLYVTNVGPNSLFRNTGGGRFAEVPKAGGASAALVWSTSCAFLDIDRDGDLDLFVTNYVDATKNQFCGIKGPPPIRDYCHPLIYPPLSNVLFRNNGKGAFEDISKSAGIAGRTGNGLGVAVTDVDDDGYPDVFVANDNMPNFLFHNEGNGTFTEIASLAGVAVAPDGHARAGMGTAFADFANTGRPGLVVTNHEIEMHTLFLNTGNRLFSDVTVRSGLGPATRPFVGFGVAFLDYDNDTRLDLAIANGNVMANAGIIRAGGKYGQRNLLLRYNGDKYVDTKADAGPGFAPELVSRALAAGDIDNDGDIDLLITNNGAQPNLLVNEGGNAGNALLVKTVGSKSNTSAIGARLTLTTGKLRQTREVQSGSSYLGQNDLRVHFGLGQADRAERLEIRWPSGATDVVENLTANQIVTVAEGRGATSRQPFNR